ncbi:MAG: HD domain-containing protein [Acidobacteriota bacterium]
MDPLATLSSLRCRLEGSPHLSALPPGPWAEVEQATAEVLALLASTGTAEEALLREAFRYGETLAQRGDETGAEEVFEAVALRAAGMPELEGYAQLRLAACLVDAGEAGEAAESLRRAVRLASRFPEGHPIHGTLAAVQGMLEVERRRWPQAVEAFRRAALRSRGDLKKTVFWEGRTPEDLEALRWTLAADALQRGVRAGTLDPARLGEAEELLDRVQALTDSLPARLHAEFNRIELAWSRGEHAPALRLAQGLQGLLRDPGFPEDLARAYRPGIHWLLALLALSKDDVATALNEMAEAFDTLGQRRRLALERFLLDEFVNLLARVHLRRYGGFREQAVFENLDREGGWVLLLADAVEDRDRYLHRGHSRRVAALALALLDAAPNGGEASSAAGLGLSPAVLKGAALLHDVGKLRIGWSLLRRQRPLLERHRRRLSRHPVEGGRILETLGLSWTGRLVEEHHERWGGKGFPLGVEVPSALGGLLALAEELVSRSSPTWTDPAPPALPEVAAGLLASPSSGFPPFALQALRRLAASDRLPRLDAPA